MITLRLRNLWQVAVVLAAGLALLDEAWPQQPGVENRRPPFTVAKETTQITEPLRADGYPDYSAAIERILSEGVKPESNAALAIFRIVGPRCVTRELRPQLAKKLGEDPFAASEKGFVDHGTFRRRLEKDNAAQAAQFERQRARALIAPWNDGEFPAVARWLQENDGSLDELRGAIKRPHFFAPYLQTSDDQAVFLGSTTFDEYFRDLAECLAIRGMRNVPAAVEQAMADSLLLHQLALCISRGKQPRSYYLAATCERLANQLDAAIAHQGKLTAAQAKGHAASLAKLPAIQLQPEAILIERLVLLDLLAYVMKTQARGLRELGQKIDTEPSLSMSAILRLRINVDPAFHSVQRMYDRFEAAGKIAPRKAQFLELKKIEEEFQAWRAEGLAGVGNAANPEEEQRAAAQLLGRMLAHQVHADYATHRFSEKLQEQTHRDFAQIALAMAAFRAERGTYPAALTELAPKFLPQLPPAPFSGESYRLAAKPTGYVLFMDRVNKEDGSGQSEPAALNLQLEVK